MDVNPLYITKEKFMAKEKRIIMKVKKLELKSRY